MTLRQDMSGIDLTERPLSSRENDCPQELTAPDMFVPVVSRAVTRGDRFSRDHAADQ